MEVQLSLASRPSSFSALCGPAADWGWSLCTYLFYLTSSTHHLQIGVILDLGASGVEKDEFGKLWLRHEHRDYWGLK